MRKLFAAVTAIGAVVLIASPVRAKGIEHAHFSGPGLPFDGVTIVRGNYNQLVKTGLIERKRKSLTALGLSRPDLGPAYRAEYRMDYAPRVTLHQTIYPYAKDGPVTFTPRGQHLGQDYESFRRGVVRRAVGSAALPRRPWLPAPQPEARRHAADPRW
jgi:hypothetical protein